MRTYFLVVTALLLSTRIAAAQPVFLEVSEALAAPGDSVKLTLTGPPGRAWGIAVSAGNAGLTVAGVAMELGTDAIVVASGAIDADGRVQVDLTPFAGAFATSWPAAGLVPPARRARKVHRALWVPLARRVRPDRCELDDRSGVSFELRIDDAPTTQGRARANLRGNEIGPGLSTPASITGVFPALGQGAHAVSLWAAGANGSASQVLVDGGCWVTDHVVVRELK